MLLSQEPALFHFQFPLSEVTFTPTEIHELLSLFDSDFPANSASGSEAARRVYSDEERKRRRTISNRESAKRSRWRKKKHLENLTGQVNRMRTENRELKNRLCLALQQCHIAQRETEQLQTERFLLQQRLSYLCQNLLSMHLQEQ
ncbi:basic leucine zipper 4-like [Diospyros lotus]|uniref:basic leucine zipper 4-like n=1 Tax=Diospyros lotus TaxID=55363 RepID=UPI00224DB6CD|nr:basic leucine zipper 4-like [Diospyros lotus]